MIKISGMELDFNLLDAQKAEMLEEELEKMADIKNIMDEETSLSVKIRKACFTIDTSIDRLFGEGTSEKIFAGKADLKEHCQVWKKITDGLRTDMREAGKLVW